MNSSRLDSEFKSLMFDAPFYLVPNSFMYEVCCGRVDVADYHEA